MSVFNVDRFFKRRTIFSNENFGPGEQNFQDQNSLHRTTPCVVTVTVSGDFRGNEYELKREVFREDIPHALSGKLRAD